MKKNNKTVLFSVISIIFFLQATANQQIIQHVLDGTTIPKFVEPVPLFNKKRVKVTKKLKVSAEEFQQKLLPATFYKTLPKSVTYKSIETGRSLFRSEEHTSELQSRENLVC